MATITVTASDPTGGEPVPYPGYPSYMQPADAITFTVSASPSSPYGIAQGFQLGGTASYGGTAADYTVSGGGAGSVTFNSATGRGTANIAYGSAMVTVTPAHDTVYEGNETVTISLEAPPAGHTLGATTTASATIADDDPPPPPPTVDLDVDGVAEGSEQSVGGWVVMNSNFDEQNYSSDGKRRHDDEQTWDGAAGRYVDNAVATDADLRSVTLTLGGAGQQGTWRLNFPDRLRVWRDNGNGTLTKIVSGANQPPATAPLTVNLKVEGVRNSRTKNDIPLKATFNAAGGTVTDTARLTVVNVDIDIDTDNNNGFNRPDSNRDEGLLEEEADRPGKTFAINNDDDNANGKPDFADGFADGFAGGVATAGEQFVPFVVQLPQVIDLSQIKLKFEYSEVAPANVTQDASGTWLPGPGHLRVWTRNGDDARNGATVANGGHFVDESAYTPAQLGITNHEETLLWLEATAATPATDLASRRIKLLGDPDGTGPAGYVLFEHVMVTATVDGATVAVPRSLSARRAGPTSVNLDWANNPEPGVTYEVYRSTTSGFEPEAANRIASNLTASQYSDTTLPVAGVYYYKVRAIVGAVVSASSAQAKVDTRSAVTVPAPTGLTAEGVGASRIALSWDPAADGGTYGYSVYRSTVAGVVVGPTSLVGSVPAGTTSYLDAGLTAGTRYYYVVVATDAAGGQSPKSNEASAVAQNEQPLAASFNSDGAVFEGGTATVRFARTSGATTDFRYGFDFDDDGTFDNAGGASGTSPSAQIPASYLSDGPFTRRVRGVVTNPATGATATYYTDIMVLNAPATATIAGAPAFVAPGAAVSLTGSATDPAGAGDPLAAANYVWTVTRGEALVATNTGTSFSFTPSAVGGYVVLLQVTDADGAVAGQTIVVNATASGTGPAAGPSATSPVAAPPFYGDAGSDAPGGTAFGADGGDPASMSYSGAVRYSDGTVTFTSADLDPVEAGLLSGHTRTWSNDPARAVASGSSAAVSGSNWFVSQWPTLVAHGSNTVAAVDGGRITRWFDWTGSGFQARFGSADRLYLEGDKYRLVDTQGNVLLYDGFGVTPAADDGRLLKLIDPGGNETACTYDPASGLLTKAERKEGGTVLEELTYEYEAGRLIKVSMKRRFALPGEPVALRDVRTAQYGYVLNTSLLHKVTVLEGTTAVDRKYYRYDAAGRLTHVLEGASYERFVADTTLPDDPASASDAQIATYADLVLRYDGAGKADRQTIQGLGTYAYEYVNSAHADALNTWKRRTTEFLPEDPTDPLDNDTNVVYSNYAGGRRRRCRHAPADRRHRLRQSRPPNLLHHLRRRGAEHRHEPRRPGDRPPRVVGDLVRQPGPGLPDVAARRQPGQRCRRGGAGDQHLVRPPRQRDQDRRAWRPRHEGRLRRRGPADRAVHERRRCRPRPGRGDRVGGGRRRRRRRRLRAGRDQVRPQRQRRPRDHLAARPRRHGTWCPHPCNGARKLRRQLVR